jgi:ribokinase
VEIASKVFVLGNFVQACCWNVPRLPQPGETLVASGVNIEAGGKGLNVAICMQRLGAQVSTLIGCGSDSAGTDLLALLEREGISAAHVHQLPGASGWGSGWIAADGQNAIAVYPGANLLLGREHVDLASVEIANTQLVYGQFETALVAVQEAFKIAHASGIATVLNPSPWQLPPEDLRHHTHTVIVNETEAKGLLAMTSSLAGSVAACVSQIASYMPIFWRQWPSAQCLIVTLGEGGSLGFDRREMSICWHVSASDIVAVDTVGAGDAFASGYCAAKLAGKELAEALRWGNVCGGYLASQAGVLGALPNAAMLSTLLLEDVEAQQFELSD